MAIPSLGGPLRHATMIVRSFAPLLQAYRRLDVHAQADPLPISAEQAQAWGHDDLAGCLQLMLAPAGTQAPLLRLIEHPDASVRPTRHAHGWLALEILVRDVDQIAATLAGDGSGFDIVGPPADLDLSPAIRAMQVIGPAGEMLYLTQVKAPVPPFQIPLSAHLSRHVTLGLLFIAVLSTASRSDTVARCATWGCGQVLSFETKITVLNRALGHDIGRRWPVATVQWQGNSLFEIDEVVDAAVRPAALATHRLPSGLAWVAMVLPQAPSATLFEVSPGAWIEPLEV